MPQQGFARVLVASDGSAPAEHAVDLGRALALRAGAELEVLGVETASLPALAAVGERVHRRGARGLTWVRGVPGVEIVRHAQQTKADLVVLGRCTPDPGAPAPVRRTADAVVRRLDGPCLVLPEKVQSLGRMVLAIDGTWRGFGILESAAALVDVLDAEVVAVHVLPGDSASGLGDPRWVEPAALRIKNLLAGLPALGARATLRISRGDAVREILSALEETRADLLVLGVRRGGPRGDMGSGHVGRDLLQTAPVAILTVPI